jgi:hypothetical protein
MIWNLPHSQRTFILTFKSTLRRNRPSTTSNDQGPFERTGPGLLKPLIAVATAQYFIVTVLAGLTAWAIASEAGEAINRKARTPSSRRWKRF